MKWLLDIVKAWIIKQGYLTTSFVDRGDTPDHDWSRSDLTCDTNFHDLDLSGIVPAGASGVSLRVTFRDTFVNQYGVFRPRSHTTIYNIATQRTQVMDIFIDADLTVALDPDRVISYMFKSGVYDAIYITVKGWWL